MHSPDQFGPVTTHTIQRSRNGQDHKTNAGIDGCGDHIGLHGCLRGGGVNGSQSSGEITELSLWDGFTQYDENSPWGRLLSGCEEQVGVTLERTTDATYANTLLQSAASGNLPDLAIAENSSIPQFAKAGLLADNETTGLDASEQMENVLASAVYDGKTYGASVGFNTLALYYNPDKLAEAGIENPPTTWDELREVAAKLTTDDQTGLGFSSIANEDGAFQFMVFLWGAGGSVTDVDGDGGVEALTYLKQLIDDGSVSTDVVNWNQQDVRDQYMAGNVAMMLNGTWQLNELDKAGVPYAVAPFPGKDGGNAEVPLGGEFIEVIATGNDARQKKAAEFAQCMVEPDSMKEWAAGQTYLIPTEAGIAEQAESDPRLEIWAEIASSARSKAAELGPDYPQASLSLQTAFQSVLTGTASPEDAAAKAQAEIESIQ